jgi:hypothetical protein
MEKKIRTKWFFLLSALLVAGVEACESPMAQEEGSSTLPADEYTISAPILFRLADGFTKAPETTASTLTRDGFRVSATSGKTGSESEVWTNASFTRTGNVFSGDKWWSPSDSSYHFYASNSDLAYHASGATVTATTDQDVVCAYLPTPSFQEPNELAFQHILARLGNVSMQGPELYTTTVSFVNITPYISGTYNLRTREWSNLQPGQTIQLSSSNDIWCIPGYYTLTVQYTLSREDYTESFTKSTLIPLQAGKTSNLSGILPPGQGTEIEFTVEVADWTDHSIDLGRYGL